MSEPTAPGRSIIPADLGIGALFTRVREAVVVANAPTGRIVLWNPAAARMFGHSEAEAVGQTLEILVPPELRDAHRAGIERYGASGVGTLVDRDLPVELPALRKAAPGSSSSSR